MKLTVKNLHTGGIAKDTPPSELPLNFWSNGNNVRFRDGGVEKTKGHTTVFGTPSVSPYFMLPYTKSDASSSQYWIYGGLTTVYVTDGTTHKAITGTASGTKTADSRWTGGIFNGVPILNNGVDNPVYWDGDFSTPSTLADLTAWPASTKCKTLRPFRNYLIALDVTSSGTRYPHRVKWSHAAASGTIPTSWDITDATLDAGEFEIGEENDACVDLIPLRESAIIYKERSAWAMTYIGGAGIFSFRKILSEHGMLSQGCGAAFGDKHFIVTQEDIIVHDGQRPQSILDERLRRSIFREIDSDNYNRSFVVPHHAENEIWFCYPVAGDSLCTKAFIWNYNTNAVTFRDLPGTPHIAAGPVASSATNTWDADSDTWDSDTDSWNSLGFAPSSPRLVMAFPNASPKLFVMDQTLQFNAVNITSYVERTGLPLFGQSIDGKQTNDPTTLKYINRVYPHMTGAGTVQISIGAQMVKDGPITWDGPYDFDIDTDYKVDCRLTGRYMAFRVRETSTGNWKLHGYDIDVQPAGSR